MASHSLLAIHAHPDDEASKGAATMAKYAAEGHRVKVVTCTGGERGDILNPAMEQVAARRPLAEIRREEMAASAEALGVEHEWLGYIDSGLPQGDPLPPLPQGCFALADDHEVVTKLVACIRSFRPDVLLTYDENGGYPHPDHIKVHVVSMAAWEAAGNPDFVGSDGEGVAELGEPFTPRKLYYCHGFIARKYRLFHQELLKLGFDSPYGPYLDRYDRGERSDMSDRVTCHVPCGDYFPVRDRALLAHATQIDPNGFFFATPTLVQQQLWPTEEFELAACRVDTHPGETDLFAGLDT